MSAVTTPTAAARSYRPSDAGREAHLRIHSRSAALGPRSNGSVGQLKRIPVDVRPQGSGTQRLRVVAEPTVAPKRRRRAGLWLSLSALVFCAAVFGVVALNAMTAAEAVEARQIERTINGNERRLSQLVAEVAALEEPSRVRQLAQEMGLEPNVSLRFLPVDRGLPADHNLDLALRAPTDLYGQTDQGSPPVVTDHGR